MPRLIATTVLGATLLILAACGDEAGTGQPPADGESPAPSPTVHSSADLPIETSADRDPREVLIDLIQDPEDPDLDLVYQSLAERFRIIPFDETWVRQLVPRMPAEGEPSVDDFLVEEYDRYSVVRHQEVWPARYVFVVENGQWRRDPGGRQLLIAAAIVETDPEAGGSLEIGMGFPDDYRMQRDSDPDIDVPLPLASGRLDGVGVREDSIDVAMTWEIRHGRRVGAEPFDSHLLEDSRIPLDGVSWRAGGQSGDVEVRWTDAALSGDRLVLKGWPDQEAVDEATDGSSPLLHYRYEVGLRLLGTPADADEIELRFEGIEVGPIGDDAPELEGTVVNYSLEFEIPAETTDPVLVGEAPDPYEEPDDSGDSPVPPAEEDLPPAPALEEELDFDGVEYDRGDETVEAVISWSYQNTYIEFPGQIRVSWDDGEVTDGQAQVTGGMLEVSSERATPPVDADVTQITFSQLVRSLGQDQNATFREDRIETKWGDFPIVDIVDDERVTYQPAGDRALRSVQIDHHGNTISLDGSGTSFNADFQPTNARLDFGSDLEEALDDLPLPAQTEVWVAESDVTIEVAD